jgi:hypothetical protein
VKSLKSLMVGALAAGAFFVGCSVANAVTFDFSFVSNNGADIMSGILSATSNGDGTYTATSSTDTILLFPDDPNLPPGPIALALLANPSPPGEVASPSGFFIYDDQLLPGQNPLITNPGLLFLFSGPPGTEFNIFSNGPGPNTYQLYANDGANVFGNFFLSETPLPAALPLFAGGLGIFGLIASSRRRKSKKQSALAAA